MNRLLRDVDVDIAVSAAIGEWEARGDEGVREGVKKNWRRAVIRCGKDEYELVAIFKKDPEIAFDWLLARIKEGSDVLWMGESVVNAAVEALDEKQAWQLLGGMSDTAGCWQLTPKVIGNNLELYRAVVRDEKIKYLHLAPLNNNVDPSWVEVALNAGYSAEQVAGAIQGHLWSWSGHESDMWNQELERLASLRSAKSAGVRQVGQILSEQAMMKRDAALEREHREAILGRRW
jgi:hypothetical protein